MEEGAVKIPRLSRKYEIGRKFGKETAPPPGCLAATSLLRTQQIPP